MAQAIHEDTTTSLESSDSDTVSASNSFTELPLSSPLPRADSAWGRASFTEAEIKKAFEVADGDRKKEELATSAAASSSSKSKSGKGGKKDDDRKGTKRTGKDKDKKKKREEENDDLHDESREAGDWDELIRACNSYDDFIEPQHFEMNEEQLKCDTFDEWTTVTETQLATAFDESSAQFDPFAQRAVNIDEANVLSQPAKPLTDLGSDIIDRIFKNLELADLDSVARVCKTWHKSYNTGQAWRDLYHIHDARIPLEAGDKYLWDELGTDFSTAQNSSETPGNVREASLNALIAAVTPQAGLPDSMDVNTFLTTYQTFTTTPLLVKKLLQRYQVPEKTFTNPDEAKQYMVSVVRPIQLRVVKIMKQLIEFNYKEILNDEDMLNLIKSFIRGFIDQTALSKQLQSALLAVAKKEADAAAAAASGAANSKKRIGALKDIYDLSTEEIARQLTLVEFETYCAIQPAEFFGQAWAKEKTHHRAPHIRKMIDRFNLITRWITGEIVTVEKIKNRVKRVVKFIKVAEELRNLHNYHTLMAVLSGLQEGPIFRLKHTLAEIPQKCKDSLKSLQDLMSADGSYATYRNELAHAAPPCIPYIGIYLRDLTYFEEGGSSAGEGLINFKKKKNVYSVIQIIQKYQKTTYDFKKNDKAYMYLQSPSLLDNEALFRLSLQIEPRNAKRNEIQ